MRRALEEPLTPRSHRSGGPCLAKVQSSFALVEEVELRLPTIRATVQPFAKCEDRAANATLDEAPRRVRLGRNQIRWHRVHESLPRPREQGVADPLQLLLLVGANDGFVLDALPEFL